MKLFLCLLTALYLPGCAYHFGHGNRTLPGGHKTVFVEIFENKSNELGAETSFTQALNRELERSGFITVTSRNRAEVILKGSILNAGSTGGNAVQSFFSEGATTRSNPLPVTYFFNYTLNVVITLKAIRSRDNSVLWQTQLNGSKAYRGAALTKSGVRSSNVLYNQSRKKQTMKLLAAELMQEAFDRLTENF